MTNRASRAALATGAALAALAGSRTFGAAQNITPKPTPTPAACARPNVAASVIRAETPATPPMAAQQGIQGTVQVIISLDADSRVVGARIQASPSVILNQAALAAARQSRFQTEIRDCRPIAADYVFTVDFENDVTFSTSSTGERLVSVIGAGTVMRAPDIALVVAQIAMQDAAADGAFKSKLAALGIGENKIRWTSYGRAGDGTTSSRQVEITVDAVANAGHVATEIASSNSVTTVAIRYALKDRNPAFGQALSVALKNAENTARAAAMGRQMQLGALKQVAVSPNDHAWPPTAVVPVYLVPVVGGFQAPNIPVPMLVVRASATVTYAIKP